MLSGSTAKCKICHEPSIHLCVTRNAHGTPPVLRHYRCPNCGLVFVGTHISVDELSNAYCSLNSETYYSEIESTNKLRTSSAAEDIRGKLHAGALILDIGCGNGDFLKSLYGNGYRLYGHEIPGTSADDDLLDRVVALYSDFDYSTVPDESFDAVTMLDVAEHVSDPHALFSACHRVLKPGGILYLHTPVVTPIDRFMHFIQRLPVFKKAGILWQNGRTSVFHLQNYTRRSLEILLSRCGFSDVSYEQGNELSWPISRYVRVYLRPPKMVIPVLAGFVYPFLATNLLNANKAIVWARRC